jgi:hypothetical protein
MNAKVTDLSCQMNFCLITDNYKYDFQIEKGISRIDWSIAAFSVGWIPN